MTEYLLPTVLGTEPQARMAKALKLGMEIDWVRAAERVIAGKIAGCGWHLEDPDGETIDDGWTGDPLALDAFRLLTQPQAGLPLQGAGGIGRRQSRRQQMVLLSRWIGLAGNAGYFLDLLDGNGCPHALCTVRPDRLTPVCTEAGVLQGWVLDKRPGHAGTPIDVEELLLLQFQPPDSGVFGVGLIESSMAKAINTGLIDRHYSALLSSGGRLSGILAPREGAITDDNVYHQLVRDWRNVTEQPEAARRLQIVRAPVDFTPTVQSVGEMQIIDLMYLNRDALLALWGVPLSQLGGTAASGLNSGETRKYDEASLWQSAVHDRLTEFRETFQAGILDRWEPVLGWAPTLCFDEPGFDDELPNFDKLAKAAGTPLRNKERRAIIGLDPFGDELLDNAIWMPVNVVAMAMGTTEDTGRVPVGDVPGIRAVTSRGIAVPVTPGDSALTTPAVAPRGGVPAVVAAKADLGVRALREQWQERLTPKLRDAVRAVLSTQAQSISERIRKNWDTIRRHGARDESLWLPRGEDAAMDEQLMRALRPALAGMAESVEAHISGAFEGTGKADTQRRAALGDADVGAVEHVLRRGGGRITDINGWTRGEIRKLVARAIEEGMSPQEAGDLVEGWAGFDEYRAERIARTELMFAYNAAALSTYGSYGVTQVQASDGDQDEVCADRDGRVFSILDAQGIEDHPNGTLDWLPVIGAL